MDFHTNIEEEAESKRPSRTQLKRFSKASLIMVNRIVSLFSFLLTFSAVNSQTWLSADARDAATGELIDAIVTLTPRNAVKVETRTFEISLSSDQRLELPVGNGLKIDIYRPGYVAVSEEIDVSNDSGNQLIAREYYLNRISFDPGNDAEIRNSILDEPLSDYKKRDLEELAGSLLRIADSLKWSLDLANDVTAFLEKSNQIQVAQHEANLSMVNDEIEKLEEDLLTKQERIGELAAENIILDLRLKKLTTEPGELEIQRLKFLHEWNSMGLYEQMNMVLTSDPSTFGALNTRINVVNPVTIELLELKASQISFYGSANCPQESSGISWYLLEKGLYMGLEELSGDFECSSRKRLHFVELDSFMSEPVTIEIISNQMLHPFGEEGNVLFEIYDASYGGLTNIGAITLENGRIQAYTIPSEYLLEVVAELVQTDFSQCLDCNSTPDGGGGMIETTQVSYHPSGGFSFPNQSMLFQPTSDGCGLALQCTDFDVDDNEFCPFLIFEGQSSEGAKSKIRCSTPLLNLEPLVLRPSNEVEVLQELGNTQIWSKSRSKLLAEFNGDFSDVSGEVIEYYSSGNILSEGKLKNGLRTGDWVWNFDDDPSGFLLTGSYVDGLESGKWKRYTLDGKLNYELELANGVPEGAFQAYDITRWRYDERGAFQQVWETGQYQNGLKTGTWSFYDDDGDLLRREEFLHGVQIDHLPIVQ